MAVPQGVVKPKTRAEAEKLVLRAPRGTHTCEIIRTKSRLPVRWRKEPWIQAANEIVALRFRVDHESDYVKKQGGSIYGIWCGAMFPHVIHIHFLVDWPSSSLLVASSVAFPGTGTKTNTTSS